MQFILQSLSLLFSLVKYQPYWLENLSSFEILNDQDSYNSKAELVLRGGTPPCFKTLCFKKEGEDSYASVFLSLIQKCQVHFNYFSRRHKN